MHSELIIRLRDAHLNSQPRCNGSNIFEEAADRIEKLESLLAEMNDYLNTNHLTSISAGSIFHQQINSLINGK